ncbi:unnamed protein product, partial [Thlaspi arvense]
PTCSREYEALLNELIIYVISGFDVTKSTPRFQLTDFDKSIRFTHITTMVPADDSFYQIPNQLFRFSRRTSCFSQHQQGPPSSQKVRLSEFDEYEAINNVQPKRTR